MTNAEIARALAELADALELSGRPDAKFKTRAIRTGAQVIAALDEAASELLARGELTKRKGIGAGIARRVEELEKSGRLAEMEGLVKEAPPEFVNVEGVGPKTARLIVETLGITTIDELAAAAAAHTLRTVKGIGEKKEQQIADAIERARHVKLEIRLGRAEKEVEPLSRRIGGIVAGDVRRRVDTVDGVDLVVPTDDAEKVLAEIGASPWVVPGTTRLRTGVPVRIATTPTDVLGAALIFATGSRAHVEKLIAIARARGLSLTSDGLFDDEGAWDASDEAAVYEALGFAWIPPELREDRGELDGPLPEILTLADLRGDLHAHTTETDGKASIEEMARAAAELGRDYLAITDHSENLKIVGGMDRARLAAQGRAIDELNERLGGKPRLLKGLEADILLDGSIDLAEAAGELDWVIGSVHSHFDLPRAEQTARVVKAIESGLIDAVGHPTGRLIEKRAPYELDLEAVAKAAAKCGVALEINSYPDRLDLSAENVRAARALGARFVVDTDSHATAHLAGIGNGVDVARRAWLAPADVVNTRPVDELLDARRRRLRR